MEDRNQNLKLLLLRRRFVEEEVGLEAEEGAGAAVVVVVVEAVSEGAVVEAEVASEIEVSAEGVEEASVVEEEDLVVASHEAVDSALGMTAMEEGEVTLVEEEVMGEVDTGTYPRDTLILIPVSSGASVGSNDQNPFRVHQPFFIKLRSFSARITFMRAGSFYSGFLY